MTYVPQCRLCVANKRNTNVNILIERLYNNQYSYRKIRDELERCGIHISHMGVKRHIDSHMSITPSIEIELPPSNEPLLKKTVYGIPLEKWLLDGLTGEQLEQSNEDEMFKDTQYPRWVTERTLYEYWYKIFEKHIPDYLPTYKKRYEYYKTNPNILDLPPIEWKNIKI